MHTTLAPVESNTNWQHSVAWLAFALTLLAYPFLLSRYGRENSATFDEGMHIAAGHRYWECGDYGINPEHPPLLKLIAAAPLRAWHLDVYSSPCGTAVTNNMQLIATGYRLMNEPYSHQILVKGRTAATIFPLLLVVTMFFAAREWFGPLAAGCAVILTVFEPNLTAHGPLVATDIAITATTFAAVFLADRYLHKPSVVRLLLLGCGLGLALASKHTAVFVPVILLIQFLGHYWLKRSSVPNPSLTGLLLGWAGACIIAVVLLWGTYQFRYSALPGRAQAFDIPKTLHDNGESERLFGHAILVGTRFHLLPESYVAGLRYVVQNSARPSYIFGKRYDTGVWFYFPVTILVKTPLTILVLFLVALATPHLWLKHRREMLTAIVPIAVFLLAAMTSEINLGVRHILPIYPFFIVLAAAATAHYAIRSRVAAILCTTLVVFQMVSYARSFPNEIAYANEAWGGPKNLYRLLGDSNVDWGQALYQVKDYVAAHNISDCWIAWFGARKPLAEGLPCRLLAGPGYVEASDTELLPMLPDKFSGTVFVSVMLTDYDLYPYLYFAQHPPDDVIAGSVLVYHGDFDLPEIAAERRASRGWWYLNHGQPLLAVAEFAAAEPHMSAKGGFQSLYGWALEASGQPQQALLKYQQAATDYAGKPGDAQWRKAALDRVVALQKIQTNSPKSE
jgi:hypothetical protein